MKILYSGVIKTDNTYHGWPTVALTKDGRLLAAASGNREGHICPMGRLRLYTSSDLGKTWDSGVQLSNGPLDDRDGSLCVAADGSVLAAYFSSAYALMTPKKKRPAPLGNPAKQHHHIRYKPRTRLLDAPLFRRRKNLERKISRSRKQSPRSDPFERRNSLHCRSEKI